MQSNTSRTYVQFPKYKLFHLAPKNTGYGAYLVAGADGYAIANVTRKFAETVVIHALMALAKCNLP